MKRLRRSTCASLLPLLAGIAALVGGGWIYVAARPGTLVFSLWHGATDALLTADMPEFVRYSLPDGLWTLSSILILHALLRDDSPRRRLLFVSAVPLTGLASEILQGLGCLPGVFDICDLLCYAIPLAAYLICQSLQNPTINPHEHIQEKPLHNM